jgi:hypothetical protein
VADDDVMLVGVIILHSHGVMAPERYETGKPVPFPGRLSSTNGSCVCVCTSLALSFCVARNGIGTAKFHRSMGDINIEILTISVMSYSGLQPLNTFGTLVRRCSMMLD